MADADPCPCGSGREYPACCGAYHAGAEAPTAEALMRARYSAYARRHAAFLARSSHPMLRAKLDPRGLAKAFALAWSGLEVITVNEGGPGDRIGTVRFRAHWRDGERSGVLEEVSRFVRAGDGAWVYRDGHPP